MEKPYKLTRRGFTLGACGMVVGDLAAPVRAEFSWPGSARAAVSLTYDDGFDSQLENVGPLLDALGLKATFFLTVENINERVTDWIALSKNGHEVGNQTMTHPCELRNYSAKRFVREQIEPAERYLDIHFGGPKPRSYAYPCGYVGLGQGATAVQAKRYLEAIRPTFLAARGVKGPPNDPREVLRQRFLLSGYEPTYASDDAGPALGYVQKAIDRGHWAILIFHEVQKIRKSPDDTSKAVHQTILERLSRQPVWCAPMRTVFNYVTNSI